MYMILYYTFQIKRSLFCSNFSILFIIFYFIFLFQLITTLHAYTISIITKRCITMEKIKKKIRGENFFPAKRLNYKRLKIDILYKNKAVFSIGFFFFVHEIFSAT